MTIDYTKLLAQIVPQADGEDTVRWRTGVVDSVNSDGTVNVVVSGLVIPNVPQLRSARVQVAEVVHIAVYRGAMYILGPVAGASYGGAPGSLVAESYRTSTVGTFTTNETVVQYVTFTAVAGYRYEVTAVQSFQSSTANDLIRLRLRWIAAGALTTAGTQFHLVEVNCDNAGRGNLVTLNATFAPGAGTVSVGVTAVRATGTGSVTMFGDPNRHTNSVIVKVC